MASIDEIRSRKEQKLTQLKRTKYYSQLSDELIREYNAIGQLKSSFSMFKPIQGTLIGRIHAMRNQGAIAFWEIEDHTDSIQLLLTKATFTEDYSLITESFELGDIITVSGELFPTKAGVLTMKVQHLQLVSKTFFPFNIDYYQHKTKQKSIINTTQKNALKKRLSFLHSLKWNLMKLQYFEMDSVGASHPLGEIDTLQMGSENFIEKKAMEYMGNHIAKVYMYKQLSFSATKMGTLLLFRSFSSLSTFLKDIKMLYQEMFSTTFENIIPEFTHFLMGDYLKSLFNEEDNSLPIALTEDIIKTFYDKVIPTIIHPTIIDYTRTLYKGKNENTIRLFDIVIRGEVIGNIHIKAPKNQAQENQASLDYYGIPPVYIFRASLERLFKISSTLEV